VILSLERDDLAEDDAKIIGAEMAEHVHPQDDIPLVEEWQEDVTMAIVIPSYTEIKPSDFASYPLHSRHKSKPLLERTL
jgi:hypothetical protein